MAGLYVIVAGAGKVGWNLARELLEKGHEVTVLEQDRRRYLTVEQELEHAVQYGDATELWVLERAGIQRADLVVAVTGDDERLVSASEDVFATDRKTALAVPNQGKFVPDPVEGREGLQNKWPFDAEKKDYEGLISGVTEWGIYVEIIETKCEGMIRLRDINDDFYVLDEKNYCIIGQRKKKKYQLGDEVKIMVKRVDLSKRQIDFTLVS